MMSKASLNDKHLSMVPQTKKQDHDESDIHQLRLANVEGRGLGFYDRDSRLTMASAVSLKLIGT